MIIPEKIFFLMAMNMQQQNWGVNTDEQKKQTSSTDVKHALFHADRTSGCHVHHRHPRPMLLPMLGKVKEVSKRAVCTGNMKQMTFLLFFVCVQQ
jgi:hypothetical protein